MSGATPPLGTLRDRVQIQQKQMVTEADGGHAVIYFPLATVWARVASLEGRQGRAADSRTAETSHAVVMRFRKDLRPGDRIVYRGRPLEILSANDLNGRRAYTSCACAERRVAG